MRLAFAIVALAISAPAAAEWTKVHESEEGTSYVDPPTIRKEGATRQVWRLEDLRKAGSRGERSVRAMTQYDCAAERQRIVTFTLHAGPMAKGKLLARQDPSGDWIYVAPNTAAAAVMRYVCGR